MARRETNRSSVDAIDLPPRISASRVEVFVPGVVAQPLPNFFAYTVAYGDFVSGLLALLSLLALRAGWGLALPSVWLFNIIGTVDLLNALRHPDAIPDLGATWYLPTFWVPMLLVTHVMIFSRLLRR